MTGPADPYGLAEAAREEVKRNPPPPMTSAEDYPATAAAVTEMREAADQRQQDMPAA